VAVDGSTTGHEGKSLRDGHGVVKMKLVEEVGMMRMLLRQPRVWYTEDENLLV
jgi:hypothetical protein